MNTSRFRFVLGDEVCEFDAQENDKSIRNALEENYPDCTLILEYCLCLDACSCENGHYIAASRWVVQDQTKPWIGNRENYQVPLGVITSTGKTLRYRDYASVYW